MRIPTRASVATELVLACMLLTLPLLVRGHDMQTKVTQRGGFVVVEASYEGEEAASYLAVRVDAPAEAGLAADAFQTGRTDRAGRFVFLPSRGGTWKVTLDDEMGHRATTEVTVGATDAEAASAQTLSHTTNEARSTGDKLLIGLSILFGLTGMLMAWATRRAAARV